MSPREKGPGAAAERRFFLTQPPASSGAGAELLASDQEHARTVLRLVAGDRCVGLDGQGRAWPLVVRVVERRRFEVEVDGPPEEEPAPGETGATLPWIEVAVALPRAGRAEDLVDALVQLGAAAITPLVCDRSPMAARSEGDHRRERLLRIAREACKQSGRLWNVQLDEATTVAALAERKPGAIVRLDPRADGRLTDHAGALSTRRFTRSDPLVLVVGPEGGFTPDEELTLARAGALALRLAPHTLRIETAAQAALAVVVASCTRR